MLDGLSLTLNRLHLRSALRGMIQKAGNPESRFRITVPRDDLKTTLLAIEPLKLIPPHVRQQGIKAASVDFSRLNPRAKTNFQLSVRRLAQGQLPEGVSEGLIMDQDGQVLEGLSSNFFAIQHGVLYTSEEGMLHGIARRITLEVANELLPIVYQPIHREHIPSLDESFLTSSSRGVLPITLIDSIPIGLGVPGPLTLRIHAAYQAWVLEHLVLL